jgi:hypothetical protein
MFDVDDEVGIVDFIQWQGDGTGDCAGHSDSAPRWNGCGIEEFLLERKEAAL